ncbi:glycosyltransferase family 1 protein [Patescibacteria group bacterium]|nr:MAG: glycosyltransferase family 1 protein [Patescibacteria group bacterium]
MRIGIDARFYGSVGKGLGRYTQKLIEQLERIDSKNQYVIFLRQENFDEYQPKNKNFQKVLANYQWYTLAEQIHLPRLLKKAKLDLVHFPHFNVPLAYRGKFVITIHDLILLHFPTRRGSTLSPLRYWGKFLAYRWVIWSALRRAERVITVSHFTKKDILSHYAIPERKIVVTHEGCGMPEIVQNSPATEKILHAYGILKPYILYVGNAYPHKNLERLARAFLLLQKQHSQLQLVLVGKSDYFYNQLQKLVERESIPRVRFAGFVAESDLPAVYQQAEAYVFPSLYEGFGLPPLEAMAEQVPVVASNHACMREILGGAAEYFDATQEEQIAEAINRVLTDQPLRAFLIEKGRQQIKQYDWQSMAKVTKKIYEAVVSSGVESHGRIN